MELIDTNQPLPSKTSRRYHIDSNRTQDNAVAEEQHPFLRMFNDGSQSSDSSDTALDRLQTFMGLKPSSMPEANTLYWECNYCGYYTEEAITQCPDCESAMPIDPISLSQSWKPVRQGLYSGDTYIAEVALKPQPFDETLSPYIRLWALLLSIGFGMVLAPRWYVGRGIEVVVQLLACLMAMTGGSIMYLISQRITIESSVLLLRSLSYLTMGLPLFWIGVLLPLTDFIQILLGQFKDANGRHLRRWTPW